MQLSIDGKTVTAQPGEYLLQVAQRNGIEIPTLCHHPAVEPSGACRLCMVEIKDGDWSKLVASCIYPAAEGLNIYTETERVTNVRNWIFQMLLAKCPASVEIKELAKRYGVTSTRFSILNPDEECMVCGLCTRACEEIVGLSAISLMDRGVYKKIGTPFSQPTEVCVACGCCVTICPTGAMRSRIDAIRNTPAVTLTPLAV